MTFTKEIAGDLGDVNCQLLSTRSYLPKGYMWDIIIGGHMTWDIIVCGYMM